MTTATITPAAPAAPAAPKGKGKAAPVPSTTDAKTDAGKALPTTGNMTPEQVIASIRDRWTKADASETATWKAREAADIAWQNARVVKVRVAYAAALVNPNKGAANLLDATRILLTDPADTAAKRTTAAKSRKNTLRPYVDAGKALDDAGMAFSIEEPTDAERKLVADSFRESNKRDKAEAKGTDAAPADDAAQEAADAADADAALGFADVVGHVARMQATFNAITSAGIAVDAADAAKVADMLATFAAQLTEYAAG